MPLSLTPPAMKSLLFVFVLTLALAGCGSEPVVDPEPVDGEEVVVDPNLCTDSKCFEAKFVACEGGNYTADQGAVAISYDILGANDGGCLVNVVYTKNSNKDWEGKSMTCTFDNTQSFQTTFQAEFAAAMKGEGSCTGELATVLNEQ